MSQRRWQPIKSAFGTMLTAMGRSMLAITSAQVALVRRRRRARVHRESPPSLSPLAHSRYHNDRVRNRVLEGYSELAEALPQIVWVADASGRIERMSQRWTEYTGMPVDEALDRGWLRALHTDDIGRLTAARRRSQATGERFDIEYRIRGVDGEYRWFLARALPIRNEAGDLDQWVGTCTEIDDQKRAERLLRFFARSGRALGASLESRKIARNLIELVVPEFADACAIFSYEGESFTLLAAQHTNATRSDAIRERFAIEPPSMNDP